MDRLPLTESYDKTAESKEQDQTAHMCRPILLYTVRKKSLAKRRIRIKILVISICHETLCIYSCFLRNPFNCTLKPFPNKPWFLWVCRTSLLKTLREKEKLLVTSNFSFSLSVFYPFV